MKSKQLEHIPDAQNMHAEADSNGILNERLSNNEPGNLVGTHELTSLGITANDGVQEQMMTRSRTINAAEIEILPCTVMSSSESNALQLYLLPPFTTDNSYQAEKDVFTKNCQKFQVSQVPRQANVIGSHVMYKLKIRHNGSM